ncbi:MAG: hypothetical protein JSV02_01065 [Dehalococcoidia bacterium]|nr:MAG: hypothetical protein JSV02_01065 [Dehalococcoidia bacterium]
MGWLETYRSHLIVLLLGLIAVDPQVAVISVSADNEFGHPAPEVVERLEEAVGEDNLYITSKHGTIELITDGTRLWVRAEQ